MKILYAPWRENYLNQSPKMTSSGNCPFCIQFTEDEDTTHFILKRYKHVFICMNKYPYNPGHILVVPFEHQSDLSLLPLETAQELMLAAQEGIQVLKTVLQPSAFNVGMNMGKDSGGSIPGHLHLHILPRFSGDTNFLSLLSETKLISSNLNDIYFKLKAAFK